MVDGEIAWYQNVNGQGGFGPQKVIDSSAQHAKCVVSADVDGDGDADVLGAYDDAITWYANTDGLGSFGPRQLVSATVDGSQSICAEDLDGDGDLDVLWAARGNDRVAWHENTDGNGGYGVPQILTDQADGVRDVAAADLDGDGDMDVLAAENLDNEITWFENIDGLAGFGPPSPCRARSMAAGQSERPTWTATEIRTSWQRSPTA